MTIPTARHTMPGWQARAATPLPLGDYSAKRFCEYVFYPPLYLAGPILTFNAFASQRRSPSSVSSRQVGMTDKLSTRPCDMSCQRPITFSQGYNAAPAS